MRWGQGPPQPLRGPGAVIEPPASEGALPPQPHSPDLGQASQVFGSGALGFVGMGVGAPTTPSWARGCVAPATSHRARWGGGPKGQRGGLPPPCKAMPPTVGRVAFEPLANEGENNLRVVKRSASPTTRSTSDFQFGP